MSILIRFIDMFLLMTLNFVSIQTEQLKARVSNMHNQKILTHRNRNY